MVLFFDLASEAVFALDVHKEVKRVARIRRPIKAGSSLMSRSSRFRIPLRRFCLPGVGPPRAPKSPDPLTLDGVERPLEPGVTDGDLRDRLLWITGEVLVVTGMGTG